MSIDSQAINERFTASNIASCRSKGLCECAHKNVNASRVNVEIIRDTTTMRTKGTDGMGLVDKKIKLGKEVG